MTNEVLTDYISHILIFDQGGYIFAFISVIQIAELKKKKKQDSIYSNVECVRMSSIHFKSLTYDM